MLYTAGLLLALTYLASAQNNPQSGQTFTHYHHPVNQQVPVYPGAVQNYPGQPGFSPVHSHAIPCRTDPFRLAVNRTFTVADRSVVCTGSVFIHRCNGACWSTFYTDPVSLTPVKDCHYCQPTHQARQQANVLFTCNLRGFAPTTRQGLYSFIQPTACTCLDC